jgi:hypothetical protein
VVSLLGAKTEIPAETIFCIPAAVMNVKEFESILGNDNPQFARMSA